MREICTSGLTRGRTSAVIGNASHPVAFSLLYSKNLSQYDRYGHQTFTARDVNQNGVIDFSGSDRVTGSTTAYITKDNALWQEAIQFVYPDFNSDRAVTTAKSRRKLTNLGVYISVSESEDIRGNVTTTTQTVDPGTGHAFATTTVPTSIQPQIQTQRYGLLVESASATAVTNRYAYDALNRLVSFTDGRGNTSTTAYNTLGQVAWVESPLSLGEGQGEGTSVARTTYVYKKFWGQTPKLSLRRGGGYGRVVEMKGEEL